MLLTAENIGTWKTYFRAALHRMSGGLFSQFDEYLGFDDENLLDQYAGQDYAEAAREEFYLQLSYV